MYNNYILTNEIKITKKKNQKNNYVKIIRYTKLQSNHLMYVL